MTLSPTLRRRVRERDKHCCQECGVNLKGLLRFRRACLALPVWEGYEYGDGWVGTHGERVARFYLELCGQTDDRAEIHHVIARNDGGDDSLGNLVTLCVACHREKTDAQMKGWAASPNQPGGLFKKPKPAPSRHFSQGRKIPHNPDRKIQSSGFDKRPRPLRRGT